MCTSFKTSPSEQTFEFTSSWISVTCFENKFSRRDRVFFHELFLSQIANCPGASCHGHLFLWVWLSLHWNKLERGDSIFLWNKLKREKKIGILLSSAYFETQIMWLWLERNGKRCGVFHFVTALVAVWYVCQARDCQESCRTLSRS